MAGTKLWTMAASITAAHSAEPGADRLPIARVVLPLVGVVLTLAGASAGVALLLGIALALTLGNPWPGRTRALASRGLTWSVVGLGAGMDLAIVGRVGIHGFGYTAVGIACALAFGTLFGRRLGVARDVSLLVTVGTAICGGSAIAAVAPAIRAKDQDVSMALITVFVLNAIALFLFPTIGQALHLGQDSFGLWCALAIHDTSSVVGAAEQYGARALEVATAAKLARALWIVPVTFAVAAARARSSVGEGDGAATGKVKRPWFIAGFLAVAAVVTFVPSLRGAAHVVVTGAHRLLAVTLFLMGLGLSRGALRSLGARPMVQGVLLWAVLGSGTLGAILMGWIR